MTAPQPESVDGPSVEQCHCMGVGPLLPSMAMPLSRIIHPQRQQRKQLETRKCKSAPAAGWCCCHRCRGRRSEQQPV